MCAAHEGDVMFFIRLVKTVTGKPVCRFLSSSRFSERIITGYRIYEFIAHHVDTIQAMPTPTHCAVVNAVACRFLAIPASLATSEHLFC